MRQTTVLRLLAAIPGVAVLACLALVARYRRRPASPRVVLGSTPIITLASIAHALRMAGYAARTLVHPPYAINHADDFDEVIPATILAPYRAAARMLLSADVLVCFFDGGPLGTTPIARCETTLLRLAGCRIIVMPYGSDAFIASRIACRAWRDGVLATYPRLGRDEARISARVDRWCMAADLVIGCIVHRETLPRCDVLTTHYYPIDTQAWTPAAHRPERDGRVHEVVVGHSPNHRGVKGTAELIAAVDRLRSEGLRIRLDLMEGIPNREVRTRLAGCDILVEQLHLGYALSAMEGMALALPVVSNLEDPAYYDLHRRCTGLDRCPIVSCSPMTVADALRTLATDPALRRRLGEAGRSYVERHHGMASAARLWRRLLHAVATHERGPIIWNAESEDGDVRTG